MTGGEQMLEELRAALIAAVAAVEPLLDELDDPHAPAAACTWCPVCALAALLRGERHPLLTAVREHGVGVLAVLREVLGEAAARHRAADGAGDAPPETGAGANGAGPGGGPGDADAHVRGTGFHRIAVQIGAEDPGDG